MFKQAIINYINQPQVFSKLASQYPQAANGLPRATKVSSLDEAVYTLARNSYMQKKEAAIIQAGLQELKELQNG